MYFNFEKGSDGIATVTMDQPGRSANTIGEDFAQGFPELLEKLAREEGLAGIVITSAKKTFLAGADIDVLYHSRDPAFAFDMSQELKAGFRRLETLGVPVVAALNGSALGGGLELALACHRRIVLDDPKIELGFPEVTLGVLPGGGGVTRLPRLIGIQSSLPYLLEGKRLDPAAALAAGVVDEIAPDRDSLIDKARAWALANSGAEQPWDRKGYKIPGGDPNNPKVAQLLPLGTAMLKKKTRGNFPAPQAIWSSVVEGASVDFETASRIESRYFAHLVTGQVSKNMITAFWYQLNAINAGESRPRGIAPYRAAKVGILGAGMMGAAIAHVAASAGLEVVLKDVSIERAAAGKGYSEKLLAKRVAAGKLDEERKGRILSRILPTASADDLTGCDVVIEAVFENRELKAEVTREAEARLAPTAIFASNTSTLPITGLAEASRCPENFIGLHFFSPADRMPLVEIICGRKTSEETLARAFDFVRQIKKTPIVVNDSRGFYTSRVFATYVQEGIALLSEGQNARAIESAGLQAGMPVGPLALSDEVSLSLMLHIRDQTARDLAAEGKTAPAHPSFAVVEAMVKEHGRAGKAAGKGFYEYPAGGQKHLWPRLAELYPSRDAAIPQAEMIERLMFVQALETIRCMDEGVLRTVADANLGSIFGWGFSPFKGGVLQYVNDYGPARFVSRARELANKYGPRFAPPASLVAKAERGEIYA